MVGGTIIGLARGLETTLVHVRDSNNDLCSIRVTEVRLDDKTPVTLDLGDSIWWQGDLALWTPARVRERGIDWGVDCGKEWDIHLRKVGYSH